MIRDIYAYCLTQTDLMNLIGGVSAGRLYPDISPLNATEPYIVYSVNSDGERDEIIGDIGINFSIYGTTALEVNAIERQLITSFDKQDQIVISSDYFIWYWSKKVSGFSTYEKDTQLYHRAVIIALKFKKKC